ncbi:hypothetical protein [Lewinella sp. IMCC34183]|uniref:hypothetical protein n=1 Tax=Lewinella sp. IMCC34183 TaxID=2248762 RepID=UPI000E222BFC|nr:hypothetical protein [Lewinella sp. IMCC34183]
MSDYESFTAYRCPNLPLQYDNTLVVFNRGESGTYRDGAWNEEFHTELTREALGCLTSALEVSLDGRPIGLDDVLLRRAPSGPGAEVVKFLPIDTLSPGLHQVRLRQLEAPRRKNPTDTLRAEITVPFYYAPNR